MIGAWETDACIFSFYANKTITTGEGGMLVTRRPDLAKRARLMRTHGISSDAFDRFRKVGASWSYDIVAPGFKYNLTDVAAALGIGTASKAGIFQERRQRAALAYLEKLRGLPIDLPARAPENSLHSWHIFPISVHKSAPVTRDDLINALTEAGVGSSVHYRPLHQMSYWKERYPSEAGDYPVADQYFSGAVSLPLFPQISDAEIDGVVRVLEKVLVR